MKQPVALILLAIPLAGSGQTARIREGTPMTFATVEALDATTAHVGDRVSLHLVKPVALGGAINGVLLPAGMMAQGIVVKAKGAGPNRNRMLCREGLLKMRVDRVTLPDRSEAASVRNGIALAVPNMQHRYDIAFNREKNSIAVMCAPIK